MEQSSQKQVKKGIRWLVGSGAIALLGIGGFFLYTQKLKPSTDAATVSLLDVELDRVEDTINESGVVELGDQQTLESAIDGGVVERVAVREDSAIAVGQVLVILREPTRETVLAQKRLEIQKEQLQLTRHQEKVAEAKKKLDLAQRELGAIARGTEVRAKELKLTRDREKILEQKSKIARLQTELRELEQLLEKEFIAANEVRQKRDDILNAQAQLRDAELTAQQTNLELQNLHQERQNTRDEKTQAVLAAQGEVKQAQLAVNTSLRQLEDLQLQLRQERQKLQQSVITSTINGKAIEISVKPGDVVKLGDPLLTIGNPRQEQIALNLNPLDARRVQLNQKVRVSVIGPDSKEFPGRIQKIANIAAESPEGGQNLQNGQATVRAIARLDTPSGTLIPGSSVNVEIILAQREKVIALSTEMIQREGEETFVWVRNKQGEAEKRQVILGLEGLTTVEIKSGLNSRDRVVVPSPDLELQPGMTLIPEGE
ncbi:HlyD family efflux transporter periplasmic adaptor subunit [Lusitaniella coriacea]|uniref:efflux RND transporter periplasmic adaptor subunit n=1 Tax=Lusitaniella coriacea TaxID=1983105 RepID=UPI003CEBDD37